MHTNAPRKYSTGKPTLGYAKTFGRWGSLARHIVQLLMAAWMMFGVATQARAVVEYVAPLPNITWHPYSDYRTPPFASTSDTCNFIRDDLLRSDPSMKLTFIDVTLLKYNQTKVLSWLSCRWDAILILYPFKTIYSRPIESRMSCPVPTVNPAIPYHFDWDTARCYREAQGSITITLSGDTTTEPWHKKRDKEHTSANLPYQAIVRDQNGQPKANVSVTINTDVTPDSGGHIHINGRPKGKLVASTAGTVSTKNGTDTITGITDSSGVFAFTFGAEEASGNHTLTTTCTGCKAPAYSTINVAIQGLMLLDADPLSYELRGETDTHINNHYFSPAAMVAIINLAHGYRLKFGTLLKINDSSLIKGGLFDITGNWAPSHKSHRRGIVLDINNYRVERDTGFERFALDNYGITAKWEGLDVTTTPHYHLWLTGKDN